MRRRAGPRCFLRRCTAVPPQAAEAARTSALRAGSATAPRAVALPAPPRKPDERVMRHPLPHPSKQKTNNTTNPTPHQILLFPNNPRATRNSDDPSCPCLRAHHSVPDPCCGRPRSSTPGRCAPARGPPACRSPATLAPRLPPCAPVPVPPPPTPSLCCAAPRTPPDPSARRGTAAPPGHPRRLAGPGSDMPGGQCQARAPPSTAPAGAGQWGAAGGGA